MTKLAMIPLLLCAGLAACGQGAGELGSQDYETVRAQFGKLYEQERYREAAALLEPALERFPEHVMANAYNLALVYGRIPDCAKGIEALRFAHERGIWFNVRAFDHALWDVYRDHPGFDAILAGNEALRQEGQQGAEPRMLVSEPEGSEANREYPLFIALHGGGGNMTDFRTVWQSEVMSTEFIVAYLQSSQMVSMDGYSWTENLETARSEIADAYRRIIDEYPVDRDQVVVGGFSSGGIAALEVVLADDFPVAGFVVLCPARPDSFTTSTITRARDRGVRGTILTTEMDPNLQVQNEMVELLEETGFPHRYVVTPDVGHWIPDDLDTMLDQAISHIRNR